MKRKEQICEKYSCILVTPETSRKEAASTKHNTVILALLCQTLHAKCYYFSLLECLHKKTSILCLPDKKANSKISHRVDLALNKNHSEAAGKFA